MYMADSTLFQKILNGEIPGNFICRGDGWGAFSMFSHVVKDILWWCWRIQAKDWPIYQTLI